MKPRSAGYLERLALDSMIVFRDALLILIITQIGCTTPLRIECSKDEIKSWHIANRSTITKQINYPPQAQRLQKHGKVVVALAVNEEGSAEESFIKQSSGSPVLDAEALKIAKTKYSPPVCSGKKTAMIVDVLINFDIRE